MLKLDLSGEDFSGVDLSGLDLSYAAMDGCCFDGANLSASAIGSVEGASFKGALLTATDFLSSCITAADFRGASMSRTRFLYAGYDPANPPQGLDEEALALCTILPEHAITPKASPDEDGPAKLAPLSAELQV
jgi:uncharacterized protein YjbI with pentapeptide repeats